MMRQLRAHFTTGCQLSDLSLLLNLCTKTATQTNLFSFGLRTRHDSMLMIEGVMMMWVVKELIDCDTTSNS